jgi:hypothetical protein
LILFRAWRSDIDNIGIPHRHPRGVAHPDGPIRDDTPVSPPARNKPRTSPAPNEGGPRDSSEAAVPSTAVKNLDFRRTRCTRSST